MAEARAGRFAGVLADQGVNDAFLGHQFRFRLHVFSMFFADHVNGGFHQIADDLFHVAADITNLGEFSGLHLDEWSLIQLREAARDLCFADAGWADHQNVLRQDFFPQVIGKLLASPAIAQCDGDGALRVVLADDVAVEFGYNLARAERGHTVSKTTDSLVYIQISAAICMALRAMASASISSRSISARAAASA